MKITRTTAGLRDFLLSQMELVAAGQLDRVTAKTQADLAGKVIKSLEVDLEAQRLAYEVRKSDGPQAVADLGLNLLLTAPEGSRCGGIGLDKKQAASEKDEAA